MSTETDRDELLSYFSEEITAQERAFCLEYIQDYNLSRAARAVGLQPNKARTSLRKARVRVFMQELQDQHYIYNVITEDWVRAQGLELFSQFSGKADVPLFTNKKGETVYGKRFYADTAFKMWNEMAKMTKAYEKGSAPPDKAVDSLASLFKAVLGKE